MTSIYLTREYSTTYFIALLAVTLVPIGVFVAVVGLAFVWKAASRNSASVAQLMGYFMVAILLVLPTISRRICQTFRCKAYDNGEHKFLEMDLEVCRVGVRVRVRAGFNAGVCARGLG